MSAELGTIEAHQWEGDADSPFQVRMIQPTDLTAEEIMSVQGTLAMDYAEPRVIDVVNAVNEERALLWRLWSHGDPVGLVVTKKHTANSGDEAFIWLFCGNDVLLKHKYINQFFDWVADQYNARWISAVVVSKVARFMTRHMGFRTHGVHVFREANDAAQSTVV